MTHALALEPDAGRRYAQVPGTGQLAPWPMIDRYPTVIGSNLTLTYISSVFRMAQTGYRQQYVDVLDELIERDGHAFAVLSQRILGVAGARLSFEPAKCDESEAELAREISEAVDLAFAAIPERRQSFSALLWGIFYGVSASEIEWSFDDGQWSILRLHWIHSRRLAYPDPRSWSVRIWDLGMVANWDTVGKDPTNSGFGVTPSDYPGKFVVHAPQLRGDYPTRDGLGRELAYWMAIKLMAARGFAQFVERFGKPWPIGYYNTTEDGSDHPRAATDDDKKVLDLALKGVGAGNLGSATLPDSVKVSLDGPTSGTTPTVMPQAQLINLCNTETSKATLGQTDTVEASSNGSRAATETRKEGTLELYRYDAACLCDTLKRDIAWWFVHLNYPGKEHLCPSPKLDVEPPPDRKAEADIGLVAVQMGLPVDADKMGAKLDIALVDKDDPKARRAAWVKQVDISSIDESFPKPVVPVAPGAPGVPGQPGEEGKPGESGTPEAPITPAKPGANGAEEK